MAKKAKTVILDVKTIANIEKLAKKEKRTPHYIMVETLEKKHGK
jgi:predicted transcriptional regulator